MEWNCAKLNEIQAIENVLFHSKEYDATLKTALIHSTSEWIEKDYKGKKVHISPFKLELDKLVELVAFNIECGNTVNNSIMMIGRQPTDFRQRWNDTHRNIINAARKQRTINENK